MARGSSKCERSSDGRMSWHGRPAHASAPRTWARRPCHPSAYTLVEIMVVLTIIVLVLAMAIPAWNTILGNRSQDNAQNQVAAYISTARADALYNRQPFGVVFFIDPATLQTAMAEVAYNGVTSAGVPALDVVNFRDSQSISKGVSLALANQPNSALNVDKYLRLGAIVFDQYGTVVSMPWGIKNGSALGNRLGLSADIPGTGLTSSLAMVLYDHEHYLGQPGGATDADYIYQPSGQAAPTDKSAEETWIDQNGVSIVINQFNGTLVKGK